MNKVKSTPAVHRIKTYTRITMRQDGSFTREDLQPFTEGQLEGLTSTQFAAMTPEGLPIGVAMRLLHDWTFSQTSGFPRYFYLLD